MKEEKKLCSEDDCYNAVVIDGLTERYQDGTPHPRALKCDSHTTPDDIKKLHRFRKEQRRKLKDILTPPLEETKI